MTLTKQQKLEAYTYAMLMALQDKDILYRFVCISLKSWLEIRIRIPYGSVLLDDIFPEFMRFRPKNYIGAWWGIYSGESQLLGTNDDRLRAIERAIELTEKLPE